jgi:hypothetical protein
MALLTLSNLLPDVLGRVEEALPTATPAGPVFWSLTGEVYPAMVDGIFEASLITGVVQLSGVSVTLAANTTWFPLQACVSGLGSLPAGIVAGIVAPLRMKAPYGIRKSSLKSVDDMNPGWQQMAPGTQVLGWGPLGVSGFFIYPQLVAESSVVMDFLYSPINTSRPYTGNETIPLQTEFTDLLSKYAAAQLRSKEAGQEAEEAATVFEEYLADTKQLSLFQQRIDSLVFSSAYGGRSQVNPRTAV